MSTDPLLMGIPIRDMTDGAGKFQISYGLSMGLPVSLYFDNRKCNINCNTFNVSQWFNWNNFTEHARYSLGLKTKSQLGCLDVSLNNTTYAGMCATVIDAVSKYHAQADNLGLPKPPKVEILVMWGLDPEQGSGSAPMFNRMGRIVDVNQYFNSYIAQFFETIHDVSSLGLPDIIIPGKTGFDIEDVYATTLHELTHAAHADDVGRIFWSQVVATEMSNQIIYGDPYAYRNTVGSDKVALAESWAHDVEYYMMYLLTSDVDTYIWGKLEQEYDPDNANKKGVWLPDGIFFDLFDVNGSYLSSTSSVSESSDIYDYVSGIEWADLSKFVSEVRKMSDLEEEICSSSYASTSTFKYNVEQLFESYGY